MRATTLFICILFAIVSVVACKSGDPALEKMAGTWEFKRYRTHPDSVVKQTTGLHVVIFRAGGALSYMGNVSFRGGSCNQAERYSVEGDMLRFQFGESNCFPLIVIQVADTAKIITHTGATMTIQWGGVWMELERKR
jgi:hypothetical protein